MFSHTRKMIMLIFTLTLISGIASPSLAYADDSSSGQTTAPVTDSQADHMFNGIEMPYTTMVPSSGPATNYYWFNQSPDDILTLAQATDPEYMSGLASTDDSLQACVDEIPHLLPDYQTRLATIDSKTTLADFSFGDMASDYTKILVEQAVFFTYLTRDLSQYKTGIKTFEQIYQDYLVHLKSYAEKLSYTDITDFFDKGEPVGGAKSERFQSLYSLEVSRNFLSGIPSQELSQLNPEATQALVTKAYNTPITDYLVKHSGKYYLQGNVIFPMQNVYIYAYNGTASTPTKTVTPAVSQPVTIHYVDNNGKSLKPDQTLTGNLGVTYSATPLAIPGYTLKQTTGNETGTFSTIIQSITYTYTKDSLADTSNLTPKDTVIYATKKIGLYRQPTFTNQTRKYWYHQKSRIDRPKFRILGYAISKIGAKRYHVRDVNPQSKTAGQTGYITADTKFTSRVYPATTPKRITVINPQGINAYRKSNLTDQTAHYRQGQVLKVKRIVQHNLTTRFVLSNGRYVTANKLLVQAGKLTMPKRVRAKGALNRYSDVRLTRKNHHYSQKSPATFTIKGWDYANANNFSKRDILRYRVAGGYISGNRHLVSILK